MGKPVDGASGTRGKTISTYASMLFQALARKSLRGGVGSAVIEAAPEAPQRTGSGKVTKIKRGVETRGRKPYAVTGHHHFEVRHTAVPHPRYGDAVPHYRSYQVPVDCNCGEPVLAPRTPQKPAVVDAPVRTAVDPGKTMGVAVSPGESNSAGSAVQCSGTSAKSGERCRTKTLHPSGLCKPHRD